MTVTISRHHTSFNAALSSIQKYSELSSGGLSELFGLARHRAICDNFQYWSVLIQEVGRYHLITWWQMTGVKNIDSIISSILLALPKYGHYHITIWTPSLNSLIFPLNIQHFVNYWFIYMFYANYKYILIYYILNIFCFIYVICWIPENMPNLCTFNSYLFAPRNDSIHIRSFTTVFQNSNR